LERALLDRRAGSAIAKLRDAAPLRTSAMQPPSGVAFEQVAPRDVADGLRIARGEFTEPAYTASERTAAGEAIAEVRDTLDATGDLLLAEGVHQSRGGNAGPRGRGDAGRRRNGAAPERFDVIGTPRSGTGLTQRVVLVSDATSTAWVSLASRTPRVLADPLLEGWAAARLGDPAQYAAVVTFRSVAGRRSSHSWWR